MPRKQIKNDRRKGSTETIGKVRYQEKVIPQWQCGVCSQLYDRSQDYCLSCLNSLYYYCYVNNQMFVTKDDSYLQLYYTNHQTDDLSSCSDHSETESS